MPTPDDRIGIPEADAYHLQYQTLEDKGTGEWRNDKITPHRSVAEDFLDSSPDDCASRVVPMRECPAEAVVVKGQSYVYETRQELEAAQL